jgi:hypothetical protein
MLVALIRYPIFQLVLKATPIPLLKATSRREI